MSAHKQHPMYDKYDNVDSVTILPVEDNKNFIFKERGESCAAAIAGDGGTYSAHTKLNFYQIFVDIEECYADKLCQVDAQRIANTLIESDIAGAAQGFLHAEDLTLEVIFTVRTNMRREAAINDGLFYAGVYAHLKDELLKDLQE